MALTMFILIGAVIGGTIGWGIYALQTRSIRIADAKPPAKSHAPTHRETANAIEIMVAIRNADPLEKEAIASRYVGGEIDWNVGFESVRGIRGDNENFEAVFAPTIDRPPTHPFIVCVLSKKTHGYLANIKHEPNSTLPVFRVKGVLEDINYDTELGPFRIGNPSVEQAAGEETTALTNDQMAAKAEREKRRQSSPSPAKNPLDRLKIVDTPDGPILEVAPMPSPPPVAPTVIEHKKSFVVVPPANQSAPAKERPSSKLTPNELFDLNDGHTPLQMVKLIAPYQGLWTEAQGEMTSQASPEGDGGCSITISLGSPGGKLRHVAFRFDQSWCDKLDRLEPKTVIKARGKIVTLGGVTLILSECELVSPTLP